MTPALPAIEVRPLTGTAQFAGAVRLQKEIWSFSDEDALPVRLFVVATKIGGQAFGAYDGDRMIGFCVALPGIRHSSSGNTLFLHSNMLGVVDGYRDKGVGRLLKLAQREDALRRGISMMEWTFDPLEMKNAYFNMQRLGAVVRRYVLNQYGVTSSHLHGGLPTDRCVAEWHMAHPRVERALAGAPEPGVPIEARIEVPGGVATLKRTDPAQARAIQSSVSNRFLDLLGRGLTVVGAEKHEDDGGSYLLGRWEP
jgi:predicted GNAT superfamily acetyltransferase